MPMVAGRYHRTFRYKIAQRREREMSDGMSLCGSRKRWPALLNPPTSCPTVLSACATLVMAERQGSPCWRQKATSSALATYP
jgi:hypothetical protein